MNGSSGNVPFKRVNTEEAMGLITHEELADNSYVGKFGEGGYGFRANAILSQVRGKDFRHEKTKKKRGSYRGGVIDTGAVNSFKFPDE
jgi:hypothetical protein